MFVVEELPKNKKMFVHVVDENFRIVYSDEDIEKNSSEGEAGRLCYELYGGEKTQCRSCPLREENKGKSIIFNRVQNEWTSVSSVPIEMPNVGKCYVITTETINNNGNTFLNHSEDWIYGKKCFFSAVDEMVKNCFDEAEWCMLSIDIENLKLFNELYGRKTGDALIGAFFSRLKKKQDDIFSVLGYFGNDDFALMMPYDRKEIDALYEELSRLPEEYSNKKGFLPVFGVYQITDREESAWSMYDRAELARTSIKGKYNVRIGMFHMGMLEELQFEHILYSDIRKALQEKEFVFVLQPKCNMENNKIMGAEALVRWHSKEKGIVSPGVFIPFLEKTGLIAELDYYVWEAVCKWMRKMLDENLPIVPISVNVSRTDIYAMDVPACFYAFVEKYHLRPDMLEIEITESVYTEDNDFINKNIARLREMGFRVLMDDFGSGYSSLNMLKDIEIDVLKPDMRFLDINAENANKGISILETIFNMAGIMGIDVIAEGVETEMQKNCLLRMGGGYGQGYYFYRPLPVEEFEEIIAEEENLDKEGFRHKDIEKFCLKDLLGEDMFSEVMINNMLGALAFYDVCGEQITVSRYNEEYAGLMEDIIFQSGMEIDLGKYFFEEDYKKIFRMFEKARMNRHDGAECDVYRHRLDDRDMWLHMKSFFLREQDGHAIYYSSIRDITEIYINSRVRQQQSRELEFLHNDMPCGVFQYEAHGGQEFIYVSNSMLDMLGYTALGFEEKFQNSFLNLVYAEDRERVLEEIDRQIAYGSSDSCVYRIEMADGSLKWVYDHAQLITDSDGKQWFYVVITDYDYLKDMYQEQEWQLMKYKTLTEISGMIVFDYNPDTDCMTLEISLENGEIETIIAEEFTLYPERQEWLAPEGIEEHRGIIRRALHSAESIEFPFLGRFAQDKDFRKYYAHLKSIADADGVVYRLVGRAEAVREDE